jgi:hypothetical protein
VSAIAVIGTIGNKKKIKYVLTLSGFPYIYLQRSVITTGKNATIALLNRVQ